MKHKEAVRLVKEKLPEKRYKHSKRVAETAEQMAKIFEGNADKCYLAGMLHDYSKYDELSDMYQYVTEYELDPNLLRSEERRVGKEGRCGLVAKQEKRRRDRDTENK